MNLETKNKVLRILQKYASNNAIKINEDDILYAYAGGEELDELIEELNEEFNIELLEEYDACHIGEWEIHKLIAYIDKNINNQ